MERTTHERLESAVVHAAIAWHIHRQPLTGEYDRSELADRLRAQMKADSETRLTEAVVALVAYPDRPAVQS